MRGIIGLGNPGKKYELTRHNTGFIFLDYFASLKSLKFYPSKFDFYYAEGHAQHAPFMLVKPSTFVNLSGLSVKQFIDNYSCSVDDILVVYDDINLPSGDVKIRFGGSDGGHNGIYSIIYHLNIEKFTRLRIGIGDSFEKGKMSEYVLSVFSKEELDKLNSSFSFCTELVEAFILGGTKNMLDTHAKKIQTIITNKDSL